jgi:hypothetical protein
VVGDTVGNVVGKSVSKAVGEIDCKAFGEVLGGVLGNSSDFRLGKGDAFREDSALVDVVVLEEGCALDSWEGNEVSSGNGRGFDDWESKEVEGRSMGWKDSLKFSPWEGIEVSSWMGSEKGSEEGHKVGSRVEIEVSSVDKAMGSELGTHTFLYFYISKGELSYLKLFAEKKEKC